MIGKKFCHLHTKHINNIAISILFLKMYIINGIIIIKKYFTYEIPTRTNIIPIMSKIYLLDF